MMGAQRLWLWRQHEVTDPECVLQAERTGFADELEMGDEGKKDPQTFGLGNWKDAVNITRDGEEGGGVGLEEK